MKPLDVIIQTDYTEDELNKLNADIESNKKKVIILFSDLCGSTSLSNDDPKEYLEKAVKHMFLANRKLASEQRLLVKTIGDEVMLAQFLVQDKNTIDVLVETVSSALTFMFRMFSNDVKVKMSISVCDDVISCEEVYSLKDLPNTRNDVLGSSVNLAARIMSLASEYQLLLSPNAFNMLPVDWQNAAKNQQAIKLFLPELNEEVDVVFPAPGDFYFKGFDQKVFNVYQISTSLGSQPNAKSIKDSGYRFKCLTLFDLEYSEKAVNKTIKYVQDHFPARSPIIFFVWDLDKDGKKIKSNDNNTPPLLSVMFQSQSFELYSYHVEQHLKDPSNDDFNTTNTVPFWSFNHPDNPTAIIKKIEDNDVGSLTLVLLRFNRWDDSSRFDRDMPKEVREIMVFNIITQGYFDNFVITTDIGKLERHLSDKFDRYKIDYWGVKIINNDKFVEWEI